MKEFFYGYEFNVYNKRLKKEAVRFLLNILKNKEATIKEFQIGVDLAKRILLVPGMITANEEIQDKASVDCLEIENTLINNVLGKPDG